MTEEREENQEIQKLKEEAETNLAGWKRAMADYQNLKKETEVGRGKAALMGASAVISAILPALDHFEDAAGHIGKEDAEKGWVKGILLIKKELEEALRQFGVEAMNCLGEKFDPIRHEAVGEGDSEGESGTIIKELQKGYLQNGEVIRPAKVILSK